MINFKLNESQIMIQSSLEKALDENFDIRKLNINAEKAEGLNHGWKEIKELGYTGIITGEDKGGFGLDIFDFGLTLETWGSKLCEGPYIENTLAIGTLQKSSNDFNKLIEDLTSSKKIMSSVINEQIIENNYLEIRKTKNEVEVKGEIINLPYFDDASEILCLGSINKEIKFIVIPQKNFNEIRTSKTITGQKLSNIRINCKLGSERVVDSEKNIVDIYFQLFTLSKCFESIGAANTIIKMTTEYIKSREQFNQPIGKFQSIQHMLTDIYISYSELKELVRYTAKLPFDDNNFQKLVSMSKIKCDEDLPKIGWIAHQLHGAIGFTWDYGLHLLTKKILLNKSLNGNSILHSKKIIN